MAPTVDPTSPTAHQEGSLLAELERLDRSSVDLQKSVLSLANNMNDRLDRNSVVMREMNEMLAQMNKNLCYLLGIDEPGENPAATVGLSSTNTDPAPIAPAEASDEGILVSPPLKTPFLTYETLHQVHPEENPVVAVGLRTTTEDPTYKPPEKPSVRDATILISTTVTDSNISSVEMTSWRSKESGFCGSKSATMGARFQNTARTRYPKKLISRGYHKVRKKALESSVVSDRKLCLRTIVMKKRFIDGKVIKHQGLVKACRSYGMFDDFAGFRDCKEVKRIRLRQETISGTGVKSGLHISVFGTQSRELNHCVLGLYDGHESSFGESIHAYEFNKSVCIKGNKSSSNKESEYWLIIEVPLGSMSAITGAVMGDYFGETVTQPTGKLGSRSDCLSSYNLTGQKIGVFDSPRPPERSTSKLSSSFKSGELSADFRLLVGARGQGKKLLGQNEIRWVILGRGGEQVVLAISEIQFITSVLPMNYEELRVSDIFRIAGAAMNRDAGRTYDHVIYLSEPYSLNENDYNSGDTSVKIFDPGRSKDILRTEDSCQGQGDEMYFLEECVAAELVLARDWIRNFSELPDRFKAFNGEWLIAWIVSNVYVCTRMIAGLFASEMLYVRRVKELILEEWVYGFRRLAEVHLQAAEKKQIIVNEAMIEEGFTSATLRTRLL